MIDWKSVYLPEDSGFEYLDKKGVKQWISKGGGEPVVVNIGSNADPIYLVLDESGAMQAEANKALALVEDGKKIKAKVMKMDDFVADLQSGEISFVAAEDIAEDVVVAKVATKEEAIVEILSKPTPTDFGIDPGTLKGKYVQALIDKPMTNAEIKALDWNTSGNLHNDVFKKLKEQGYAGVYKGKKWVSLAGEPPASLLEGGIEAIVEEAAPAVKVPKDFKVYNQLGNVKARGYAQADMDYLFEASNVHLSELDAKYVALEKLTKDKPRLKGLRLDNAMELPDGAGITGKYTSDKRTISLAGELSKEHSLTLGGYNASADYYGVLRHEYGHHLWDTNKSESVVDDFRQLYMHLTKGKPTFFKSKISAYASTVEDAFSEAFSAYTSPLYKKGKLPKDVENFFDHYLSGKKATFKEGWPVPQVEGATPPRPKKGVMFADKAKQKDFEKYVKEYENYIRANTSSMAQSDISAAARQIYKNDIKGTWLSESASRWQGSTHNKEAQLIKFKAEMLESRPIKTRITKMSSSAVADLWAQAAMLPDEPYIRARALSRAYYNVLNKDKIKMYRGISGDHGVEYKRQIKELQKQFTTKAEQAKVKVLIKEDSMVGYTTRKAATHDFGPTILERMVDTDDILLSDGVWAKGGYKSEYEHIMIGGNYEVPLDKFEFLEW